MPQNLTTVHQILIFCFLPTDSIKPARLLFTSLLLLSLAAAQEPAIPPPLASAPQPADPAEVPQRVRSEHATILPDGRKLTIQHVDPPPVVSAPPAPAAPVPLRSAAEIAARRAAMLAAAPLETRILSITATVYPGGLSHLSWRLPDAAGQWREMEAWSRTDYTGLGLASEFDVGRTRYWVFAAVMDGTQRYAGRRALPDVNALPADGSLLINGHSTEETAAPVLALHQEYQRNAAVLTAAAKTRAAEAEAEKERQMAAPPQDIVVRLWDAEPVRPAAARASRTKGGAQ